ncbi:hypothetical protein [Paraburkholderia dinghuensis]|uniref:Uncharacterized protein n=1 Tax=Paraburkholderia dinghuensis TaxID=2305225 RepID=A0A3N6Q2U0_9BURK|nr:hypothetical protein [Paraburkholderia dinghuensis]RQH06616.1 hypothetical protein D1Y85_12145 [Paraburkholderia dinghuensis]
MQVSVTGFFATLAAPLAATDAALALNPAAQAELLARLAASDANEAPYAYLYAWDGSGSEVLQVSGYGSTLVLERDQDAAPAAPNPRSFPKGACVDGRVTYAGVKDLICHYDCCAGACPCEAVAAAGMMLPPASVGVAWQGMVVFSGALPMALVVEGLPAWMSVTAGANFVTLAGTPAVAASYLLSVAATNCNGALASQAVTLEVGG